MGISHKSSMKSKKNISNSKSKFLMKSNMDDSGNVSETEINDGDMDIPTTNAGFVETEEITSASSDSEEEYEKAPRLKKEAAVRNLLPIKGKDGLIFRSEIVKDEDDKEENAPLVSEDQKEVKKGEKSLILKYVAQRKTFEALKRKIALLCTSVIEDPENHMNALKELITMLLNPTTQMIISEKRILCISLLHVFTDILPGYRIRIPEEKETKIKLKKETRKLLSYEKNLLRHYKKYLDHLHDLTLGIKARRKDKKASAVRKKALREICLIAVKCMCELLYTRFSFNYFKNIANKLVPLAISKDEEISDMCCKSFEKMFKADKLGEASHELIIQIVNVIKERKFCVPGAFLRTFLSLNLREAKPVVEKIDMKKGRAQWCKMSRTERKNKKKIKDLEAELKEAQAYECVENVKKFHTETLKKIFWVYFHVLKDGEKVSLIAPALEGLSNFAYLINLEFFDDLNSVICRLMESGTLSNVEKLHGVHTLFTILAGQAESLHIDPHRIYCHMYQSLLHLNHLSEVKHFSLVLKCLEFNILRKKKKISSNRILAFAKRISIICMQTPVHGTLGLLSALRNIMLNISGADILLDSESMIGSGIYYPELEDPEHCNARSTSLWELHLLKKHFNPVIKLYSQHLLHGCKNEGRLSLPDKLSKSSPEETLNLFSEVAVENKFDFLEQTEEPPRKKFKSESDINNFPYNSDINLKLGWKEVMDINFLEHFKTAD